MKKGRGLAMIMSLVKGDVLDKEVCEKAKDNRAILKVHMNQEEIKGAILDYRKDQLLAQFLS